MTRPDAASSKAEWRRWARAIHRQGIAEAVNNQILAQAAAYLASLEPTTVVLFSSLPGEVDVDRIATMGRHRYGLTRTPPKGWLTIHHWDAPRERHPYGFSQPVADSAMIAADEVGVVLVPGLAFDRRGVRLGRGAGYYDELFSRLPESVRRVGITPAAVVVPQLPRQTHDITMHLLITEGGVEETSPC